MIRKLFYREGLIEEKVCDFCHEEQGTIYKTKDGKDICEYCKGEQN